MAPVLPLCKGRARGCHRVVTSRGVKFSFEASYMPANVFSHLARQSRHPDTQPGCAVLGQGIEPGAFCYVSILSPV